MLILNQVIHLKWAGLTLGSDDLIIFKCFRVYFSLKRKLSNFCFRSTFIFNKKEPQSCQFATYRQNALFEFFMPQTGFSNSQSYHEVVMYLFNSLAKSSMPF